MKPLSLEFTAFGSYPGKVSVDFSSLADLGLYVVTGPTGSGKTTIFDAMAYALYGEVPGARDKGDVRSQHADAEATCSVVFHFSVNGSEYRVERTPEQYRPRIRGGGDPVKVAPKAALVREDDDKAIASQTKKVTTACVELVGLDAEQFERVVLLPQGQFQEFLLANTASRLPLLRQLFGTGKWLTVVGELQEQAKAAKAVVEDIESQLGKRLFAIASSLDNAESLLPNAGDLDPEQSATDEESEDPASLSIDTLANRFERLERRSAPLKNEERRLTKVATEAGSAFSAATSLQKTWDARVALRNERQQIDEGQADYEERKASRNASQAADPVVQASKAEQRHREESANAIRELEFATTSLADACVLAGMGEIRDVDDAADNLIRARAQNRDQQNALAALAEATRSLTELTEATAELADDRDRCVLRMGEIDQVLDPLDADKAALEELVATEPQRRFEAEKSKALAEIREELVSIGSMIAVAKTAQDAAKDRQQVAIKAFDDSAAPRLAESLVPGEACPVCGSTNHPYPASSGSDQLVDSVERDEATNAVVQAAEELRALGDRQQYLIDQLGASISRSVEELSAERDQLIAAHLAASRAGDELKDVVSEIALTTSEKEALKERVTAIDLESAGLEPRIASAEKNCAELRIGLGDLAEALGDDSAAAIAVLQKIENALDDVESSIERCRAAARQATGSEATAKASADLLAEVLAASPFATVAEAEAVALDSETVKELADTIIAFETQDARNRTLLDENLKLIVPDDRPDSTELERVAEEAQLAAQEASNALGTITGQLDQAQKNLSEAKSIADGSRDALQRMNDLQSLAKTCDGQGPKRIALETWVLAGELERVAAAANFHLRKMTNGRYQIERSDDSGHGGRQSGLDLRVLDAHTGASRRPGSLSGGEQFQASLALALGLADVIGHGGNANGRVFEALFVDEGFGSLDPDSLDQAVDALVQIQATGRTVGVITHVEAMKESLPIGIRVDRLPNGKGSTLTVRPEI